MDCFCIGRLINKDGVVRQYTAVDVATAYAWAEPHISHRATRLPDGPPSSPADTRYLMPSLSGLRRDLDASLEIYNTDRAQTGRRTNGRTSRQALAEAAQWHQAPEASLPLGERTP